MPSLNAIAEARAKDLAVEETGSEEGWEGFLTDAYSELTLAASRRKMTINFED